MILETEKAAMEIPASVNGTIKKILINVGDMVKQGMPFVEIEVTEILEEDMQDIENDDEIKNREIEEEVNEEIYEGEIVISQPLIPALGDVDEVEVIEVGVEVGHTDESKD